MSTHNDPTTRCPLAQEWREWSADKRADRLFMTCPACGAYGSHVDSITDRAGGWVDRARAGVLVAKDMTGGAA